MSDGHKGRLFVYTGASGVGKGTIMKKLLEADPTVRLSISATTRAPRKGEADGREYYFVTKDKFREMIADNGFLEHTYYCGNYYGTPKKPVEDMLESGLNVFLEIEITGGMKIIDSYPECVSIFIMPPNPGDLETRLRARGTETEEQITARLCTAAKEMTFAHKYQYKVVNDKVDRALDEILSIIAAETGGRQ